MPVVEFFKEGQEFGELSNFYRLSSPIVFDSKDFYTSEALFQSCKYIFPGAPPINTAYVEQIRTVNTPYKSKILANQTISHRYEWNLQLNEIITMYQANGIVKRPDWEQVKDGVMKYVLLLKFQTDHHCREVLKSTGTTNLREISPYDKYWGWYHGKGENKLGKLLEEVRSTL